MSRIGKLPITVPDKVSVSLKGSAVTIKGPKGTLSRELPPSITVALDKGQVVVSPVDGTREARAFWGLGRSLLANMVQGVTQGFERKLLVEGVGYRVAARGTGWLHLTLGFSHPILYELPDGVTAEVEAKTNRVTLRGMDKEKVGLAAATIRGFRPPEPYKGKGVRYADEIVRRKVGKAGAK